MTEEALGGITVEELFRMAPVGLGLVDADKRYVRINEVFAAMNGVPAGDHIGRTPSEVLPDVGAGIESVLDHVLQSKLAMIGVELDPPSAANDSNTVVRISLHPLIRDGVAVGVLGVAEVVPRSKGSN